MEEKSVENMNLKEDLTVKLNEVLCLECELNDQVFTIRCCNCTISILSLYLWFLEHENPGLSSWRLFYANQQEIIASFFIPYISFKYKANFLPRQVVDIGAVF